MKISFEVKCLEVFRNEMSCEDNLNQMKFDIGRFVGEWNGDRLMGMCGVNRSNNY